MNESKTLNLIPNDRTLYSMTSLEKKAIAENAIEEVINQIELENRNPTEWESEALSSAFGFILLGTYIAAKNEAMFCYLNKDEVARPEHWWHESESITVQDLRDGLAYVRGVPPRGV